MEVINESTKLVAQAIEILKEFHNQSWYEQIESSIKLLEHALVKLTDNI